MGILKKSMETKYLMLIPTDESKKIMNKSQEKWVK